MSKEIEKIYKFMKFNLADYETEFTFEKHQIAILLFEYGKHQQQELEKLRKENEELRNGLSKMPLSLTAENGAKSLLIGEFYESIETQDEDGNSLAIETVVQWSTIKDIYKKIVEHYTKKG